jgi:flagellar FliL protein
MPTLIVAVVVAVILGGIGFVLAYFVLPSQMAAAMVQAKPGDTTTPVTTEHPARSPAEVAAQGGKPVTRFTIEEITVNIAETRGSRYVRAGVYFEADGPVLEELEANRARIVDTLGQILSTKTLDDLTSPSIRGTLRQELLGIINPTLKSGRVDNVYFTDLLVQ